MSRLETIKAALRRLSTDERKRLAALTAPPKQLPSYAAFDGFPDGQGGYAPWGYAPPYESKTVPKPIRKWVC